jgi:hypothetical protein
MFSIQGAFMRALRRRLLPALAAVLVTAPAMAQMPPGPGLDCVCLKLSLDDAHTDMATKQSELEAAQAQLNQFDAQLAAARAQTNVSDPQSVAQFRQLLAQRDTAFRQSHGDLLAADQAAVARYNQAVADYNAQCAGRPQPPPPGPVSCPGVR